MSVAMCISSPLIRDRATTAWKRNENIVPRRDISVTLPSLRNVSDSRVENPAETNSRKSSPGNGRRGAHISPSQSFRRGLFDTGDTLKTCPDCLRESMHSRGNDLDEVLFTFINTKLFPRQIRAFLREICWNSHFYYNYKIFPVDSH